MRARDQQSPSTLFQTFIDNDDDANSTTAFSPVSPPKPHRLSRNKFVNQRKLGDETLYVLDRARLAENAVSGNLLPTPTLLLNRRDLGETHTSIQDLKKVRSFV